MDDFTESAGFQELLGHIKGLRTDMAWMRKEMGRQAETVKDLDQRVRDLEQAMARIEAKQRPAIAWTAVVATIASIAAVIIVILDRIYGTN